MSTGAEKREGQRSSVKMLVMGEFKEKVFSSTAQNISASGILVETETVLAQGDSITCSFVLQHKMTVTGEVTRVARKNATLYACGIRFLNLDPRARGQIEEVVRAPQRP